MSGTISTQSIEGGIVLIEIDAPPRNAMGPALLRDLLGALEAAENDLAVRVVVLTGKGNYFCAGADLRHPEGEKAVMAPFAAVIDRIESLRVPVIAAVQGPSAGGGLELALVCDIRIASEDAYFIAAGVNVGLISSVRRLPRLIGVGPAKAMILTGLQTDAQTALRYGLVTQVCPRDELLPSALKLARRIATRAPLSVEASKRMVNLTFNLSGKDAEEAIGGEIARLKESADHKEAVTKFPLREAPVFVRA